MTKYHATDISTAAEVFLFTISGPRELLEVEGLIVALQYRSTSTQLDPRTEPLVGIRWVQNYANKMTANKMRGTAATSAFESARGPSYFHFSGEGGEEEVLSGRRP